MEEFICSLFENFLCLGETVQATKLKFINSQPHLLVTTVILNTSETSPNSSTPDSFGGRNQSYSPTTK